MTKRNNSGAREAPDNISSIVAMMQGQAANSFLLSQRAALEAARFWARRMHAYADQMEALCACSTPDELASVQTRFLERMRDDYAAESKAIGELITTASNGKRKRRADKTGEAAA